ncbi:3803_t:CDS:10 [Diversispora eburnea]|uniref:3803_t:CDS:1 n=1 Tax=Diversispora eburnea TaxID=1213867 RepID=A0A9N8Z0B2_9GLOM|nr:3803_t:CDS:10 [Diversispora eburnea]
MSYTRKSIYACTPSTIRGKAVQLGLDPKGQNFLYTNGKTVIIRNIAVKIATEYTGHSANATVAKYSPSGYYIASGEEQILKNEIKVIAGRINDIDWDFESKRLIAVGEEITGHSKVINSVSIRQQRPFRAATASDDSTVVFYHGVPFKYNGVIKDHTAFVQDVKFSPDGEKLVTVGKTGNKLCDLSEIVGEDGHKGGVLAVSWSSDSKKLLTSSADKTVKIWDIEAQKVDQTFKFSDTIEDQQIGNLWQGEHIISLSLSGDINYLSLNSSSPVKVVKGHQKAITAFTKDKYNTFYTGKGKEGSGIPIVGTNHTNSITQLVPQDDKIISIGMDDTMRVIDVKSKSFSTPIIPTESQPKGLTISKDDRNFVATQDNKIKIIKNDKIISIIDVTSPPGSIALNPDCTEIVVGFEDAKVRVYKVNNNELKEEKELTNSRSAITAISYSLDGTLFAVGDSQGKIFVYDSKSKEISRWVFHTARINSIAWSPDNLHAVSGSLDTNIYIWSVEKPMKNLAIKAGVNGVNFLDNNTIVSVGQDACLKTWTIEY